ncbi:MAG: hypothetical protein WC365_06115 [Candidatus Babeliales bacterium]|jgi:hypothetical protein
MKWSKHILTIILVLVANTQLNADGRIVIYLTHPQREVITGAGQRLKNYTDLPLSGFACIYAGYLDWSDTDGLVSFPLRHTSPKIYVAVTPRIELVNVKESTYSHRKFVPGQPAVMYRFERKTDTKNNLYWEVTTEKIPADLTINPLAIVIITNPSNIYITTGNFICTDGGQMVLPPFYVVGRNDNKAALSNFSSIQRFFEPVTKKQEKTNDNATRQLIKTI